MSRSIWFGKRESFEAPEKLHVVMLSFDTEEEALACLFEQYVCERCGVKGVCQEGHDVFVGALCTACFEKEWLGYTKAVSGKKVPWSQCKEEWYS